jgi:hypothetical protein
MVAFIVRTPGVVTSIMCEIRSPRGLGNFSFAKFFPTPTLPSPTQLDPMNKYSTEFIGTFKPTAAGRISTMGLVTWLNIGIDRAANCPGGAAAGCTFKFPKPADT